MSAKKAPKKAHTWRGTPKQLAAVKANLEKARDAIRINKIAKVNKDKTITHEIQFKESEFTTTVHIDQQEVEVKSLTALMQWIHILKKCHISGYVKW